jgi:hypothetical protein
LLYQKHVPCQFAASGQGAFKKMLQMQGRALLCGTESRPHIDKAGVFAIRLSEAELSRAHAVGF